MKLLLCFLLATSSLATVFAGDEIDDLFGTGEQEFKYQKFGNEEVLLMIEEEAKIACKNSQCVLSSVTQDYKDFSISFNLGNSPQNNGGDGTNIYLPGSNGSANGSSDGLFVGLSAKFSVGTCKQEVLVPKSLFYAINRYMWGLMKEDGSTEQGFTPADEAMILFFTTIMKQVTGCKGGN
jgi:hypothetical protein